MTLPADFVPQLEQGMLSGYLSDGPGDETQRDPKRKEARDSLAAKALERRRAAQMRALADIGGIPGMPGDLSARSDESYTGTSFSGTTIDEETYQAEQRARGDSPPKKAKGGGSWFGWGKASAPPDDEGSKRHRRHFRRHRRPKQASGDEREGGFGGFFDIANTPSFMLPLFSKLVQEASASKGGPDTREVEAYRKRWDAKYVRGGMGGEINHMSSFREEPRPPVVSARRAPAVSERAPPKDNWGVVRERLPEIRSGSPGMTPSLRGLGPFEA